jgi:hypothetical protein
LDHKPEGAENPRVGGSIPSQATNKINNLRGFEDGPKGPTRTKLAQKLSREAVPAELVGEIFFICGCFV